MSTYKTTMTLDLMDCDNCKADPDKCETCNLGEMECEIVCDVEPYRPAKINCSADDSYPSEGGVSITDIIRTDTKQSVYTEDIVDRIIDKVAESYAEDMAQREID